MDAITWDLVFTFPDSTLAVCDGVIKDFEGRKVIPELAQIHRNKAVAYIMKAEYNAALIEYQQSENICLALGNLDGLASTFNGFGIVFSRLGQHARSIEYYYKSLTCFEKLNDKQGMAIAYNNIGLIHEKQEKFDRALELYRKVLEMEKLQESPKGINTALTNIAGIFLKKKEYRKALNTYEEALTGATRLNDEFMVATIRNNMGGVYLDMGEYDSALYNFYYSLPIRQRVQDIQGLTDTYNSISQVYFNLKQGMKSLEYAYKSYQLAQQSESLEGRRNAAQSLSAGFELMGNTDSSLKYFKEYVSIKDSLINSESTEKLVEEELQYNFDQREREMLLNQQRKDIIHAENNKRQQLQKTYMGIGLALCLVFLLFIFRSLQARKKANKIITEQKLIVEEKNKEVLDSIRYAKHIQEAILPAKNYIDSALTDYFIYYLPKDIVSGDFYWVEKFEDRVLFAVVDCTGHGVPGAFISIVAHNNLYRCVKEFGLRKPAEILDKLNLLVNETLRQRRDESNVKDGMDVALCSLKKNADGSWQLEYAGANNPLFLYARKGSLPEKYTTTSDENSDYSIYEIKADRQPVGNFLEEWTEPFNNHSIRLNENDRIYIFSDGITDQFGGPNGKKYKHTQLKLLFSKIGSSGMLKQREELHSAFHQWKGELEQIDDVCVMGIKL